MSKSEIEKLNTRCSAIEHVVGALICQLNDRQQADLQKAISERTRKYNDPELSSLATRLGTGA